jgi:hypothetical protein
MRKKILQLLMPKVNVGNLKKNRETFDKLIKTTDTYVTKAGKVDPSLKEALRKAGSKSLQKTDKILRTRKKDGGRMGLKKGTGLMKKKSTKFGMLSVKAGIDKNPNPTQADRIAGAKMKNKKKVI